MIARIRSWWVGLTPRERWLVGIAASLGTAVLAWLIALGLATALADARTAHAAAVDRAAAIAARVDAIEAAQQRPAARTSGTGAASVDLFLAQSAAERGFTLSRNEPQGGTGATIAIANARAPALLAWLSALEDAGLIASEVSIRPNADGTVALTATVRRPA